MAFSLAETTYDALKNQRQGYLTKVSAPLDGMWENTFFPAANLWKIAYQGRSIGYCAVNSEKHLLGFDVIDPAVRKTAFAHCLQELSLQGAYASTAEAFYLSLCMDHQKSLSVNALMYEDGGKPAETPRLQEGITFRQLASSELGIATAFGIAAIGADPDWLTGYFTERLSTGELFGLWRTSELLATGELRLSPNQKGVADVGMIVATAYRGQGLATHILKQLQHVGRERSLRLICSTQNDNLAAQIAISRAGFVSGHRILHLEF